MNRKDKVAYTYLKCISFCFILLILQNYLFNTFYLTIIALDIIVICSLFYYLSIAANDFVDRLKKVVAGFKYFLISLGTLVIYPIHLLLSMSNNDFISEYYKYAIGVLLILSSLKLIFSGLKLKVNK